jgi:hypothetical protein
MMGQRNGRFRVTVFVSLRSSFGFSWFAPLARASGSTENAVPDGAVLSHGCPHRIVTKQPIRQKV